MESVVFQHLQLLSDYSAKRDDGDDYTKPDQQGIYLKATLVNEYAESCVNDEYKLANEDCQKAFFMALNDGCDTDTRTEKYGGTYIKYTLSGTGTPKYAPGSAHHSLPET